VGDCPLCEEENEESFYLLSEWYVRNLLPLEEHTVERQEIQTDLLGRRARIMMKYDNEADLEKQRWDTAKYVGWRRLGDIGEIRAVYLDEEGEVKLMLVLEDDTTAEVWASHCKILPPPPPNPNYIPQNATS
jgi:hypothetical protein